MAKPEPPVFSGGEQGDGEGSRLYRQLGPQGRAPCDRLRNLGFSPLSKERGVSRGSYVRER